MIRAITTVSVFLLSLASAQALEISFRGGATVVGSPAACNGNPELAGFWDANYFFPMVGTTNGTTSTLVLINNGTRAFQITGGITTSFGTADAYGIFTRAGKDTNGAQIRLAIAQPAVNTTTRFLNLRFQIKGWDNVPTCIATFDVALVRYAN